MHGIKAASSQLIPSVRIEALPEVNYLVPGIPVAVSLPLPAIADGLPNPISEWKRKLLEQSADLFGGGTEILLNARKQKSPMDRGFQGCF